MIFGVCTVAWSGIGLYLLPKVEEKYGMKASEKEKEELRDFMPSRYRKV